MWVLGVEPGPLQAQQALFSTKPPRSPVSPPHPHVLSSTTVYNNLVVNCALSFSLFNFVICEKKFFDVLLKNFQFHKQILQRQKAINTNYASENTLLFILSL